MRFDIVLAVALGLAALTPLAAAPAPSAGLPDHCAHPHPCEGPWDGVGRGPFELAEVREVWVEAHDGVRLHGWIGLPDLPADVADAPVALHSSPYLTACVLLAVPGERGCVPGPGDATFWSDEPSAGVVRTWGVPPIELVRRGFAAAFFDVRGTGGSDGCIDWGGPDEQRDQAVLVSWLAEQDWSNGRVAMGGNSYPAGTAWEAAVQAPEGLRTIVTAGVVTDWYTFHHTPQGALHTQYIDPGIHVEASTVYLPHAGAGGDPASEAPLVVGRAAGCEPLQTVTEPTAGGFLLARDPDFWEPRRYLDRLADVRAAVLMAHGLRDVTGHAFQDMSVWEALGAATPRPPGPPGAPPVASPCQHGRHGCPPAQMPHTWQLSGQWGHGPPFADTPALTPEWVRENWSTILFDWLGYWLQGVGEVPPHQVDYQDTTGAWHRSTAWPPPSADEQVLYLGDDRLSPHGGTGGDRRFRAAPSPGNDHASAMTFVGPVPAGAWSWCRQEGLPGSADTAVAYISDPFAAGGVVAGNPVAHLELSADQPGGVVEVAMVRWPADASCTNPASTGELVARGAADLRHHHGGLDARPFPITTPAEVRIDLYNAAVRFHPGDRLVVVVSGTEGLGVYTSLVPHTPEVTVHAGRSHVVVPIVPVGPR